VSPIAEYLEELAGQLRRGRRRRILAEVGAHLLESAAADTLTGGDRDRAERGAIERFGAPAKVASQFNALRRRPLAIMHRAAAVMLASAAMATLGTATVWAIEPGAASSHAARSQTAGHVRLARRSHERP
jgi:hypothetical protein